MLPFVFSSYIYINQFLIKLFLLSQLDMEFQIKPLPPFEDPFNWKDCENKINTLIGYTKSVQASLVNIYIVAYSSVLSNSFVAMAAYIVYPLGRKHSWKLQKVV